LQQSQEVMQQSQEVAQLFRHNYFNKDGCGLGFRVKDLRNGP
jgi:hypothetical protein